MPLTDAAIRSRTPGDKPIKVANEKGLFLLVSPAGGKSWRLKYGIGGREGKRGLGRYALRPRPAVLHTRDGLIAQAATSLAKGCAITVLAGAALAAIDGPIPLAQTPDRAGRYRLDWLVEEVEIAINMTAAGGNATLMALV